MADTRDRGFTILAAGAMALAACGSPAEDADDPVADEPFRDSL